MKDRNASAMKKAITKKKRFLMLEPVKDFMRDQDGEIKKELNGIIWKLEQDGVLQMPYGEKITGENLFAIRVIQAGNIRVFYVYGNSCNVFGIHAYEKKTEQIPEKDMKFAKARAAILRKKGWL